jgi:hypothetical protein
VDGSGVSALKLVRDAPGWEVLVAVNVKTGVVVNVGVFVGV